MCQELIRSETDPSLFYYVVKDKLCGIIALHVDDALYGGNDRFDQDVIKPMMTRFQFGKVVEDEYRTLGWNVEHDNGNIYVSQADYIESRLNQLQIQQAGLHESKTKLTEENKGLMRQQIGKLRWVSDQSRPDISYEELELSMAASSPTVKDWKTSNKMIRELKENDVKIKYKKLRRDKWYISVFTDASVGKLPDGVSSAAGIIIFLSNGYRPKQKRDCCVLSWRSSKVKRVVSSSYDAEVLALSEGLEEALVLRKLLLDMTRMDPNMLEIEAFCDNEDTIKALNMSKPYYKGKRIGIEVAKIKEMWTKGEVKTIQWVPGQYQLADGLTKKEASRTPILEAIQNGSFMN